ncbi:ExeA family protein [Paracoccus endophyticus]|uniref:ExeA family protein n=1 Tax=Paracoccus endophyticus TaxID=2233774 RepID=UPI0013A6D6F0|nr:AAA family ATPase [Paracoccus endophyticus]
MARMNSGQGSWTHSAAPLARVGLSGHHPPAMSVTYLDHFGLRQAPFGLLPNPALFHGSRAHQRALDWIENGVAARAPMLWLSGEAGTGKTTLLRRLLDRHDTDWTTGLVSALHARPDDILDQARHAFGLPDNGDGPAPAADQIRRFARQIRADGGFVVLMVDDAQALDADGLLALASLVGDTAEGSALTLLLAGRPDLRALREAPAVRGLPVAQDTHVLAPLSEGDTAAYVEHRLDQSGADAPIFTVGAMQILHSLGHGVPRLINITADCCLATAAAEGVSRLDGAWVSAVLHEAGDLLNQRAERANESWSQAAIPADGTPPQVQGTPQRLAAPVMDRAAVRDRTAPDLALAPAAGQGVPAAAAHAPAPYPMADPVPLSSRRRPGPRLVLGLAAAALASGAAYLWLPSRQAPAPAATEAAPPAVSAAVDQQAAAPAASPPVPSPVPLQAPVPVPQPVAITSEPTVTVLMQRALQFETQDPAQAALAYARAAIRGHDRAAYYLGQLHETGMGVEESPGTARLWYAAASEVPAAQQRLRTLSGAAALPGTPAPPQPVFQARLSDGSSEMIWRVPDGVTPVRFRVESFGPEDEPMSIRTTSVPGLLVPFPVSAWRVTAVGADGSESAPSAMVRMIPADE